MRSNILKDQSELSKHHQSINELKDNLIIKFNKLNKKVLEV